VLLHSLVGGRIDPGQWRVEGALPEAGEEVAAEAGSSGLAGELTEFLRGKLPPYMVPPVFVPIDAMPLTANGKLDREALPRPGERTAAPQTAYVPPATELARRIAGIIREVLKVERVGLYDNFFDMGGNSLHVVRAHQRLQEELGREFPLVSVFQHPNVQALTDYFGAGDDTPSPRPRQGLDRGRRRRQTLLARQPELPAEGAAERIPEAVRRDAE
jgi:acyl carrier protein